VKTLRMLAVICVLVVLPLGAASAQQGTRTFHDPRGWFSVNLPADWTLAGERSLGASFIQGFERGDAAGMVRSFLAADGPNSLDGYALPFIGLLALELPRSVSPRAFGQIVTSHVPSGWTQTQEGEAKIAGRDAFYVYLTRGTLYAVLVAIPTPKAAYLVMAGTVNQPDRVNADFATIAQILESIRPK
jgi:hypothetical protein